MRGESNGAQGCIEHPCWPNTQYASGAIAGYLYVLWRANYYRLDDVARKVAGDRALFYARRLAERILQEDGA
jgi:hypothetical protein